MAQQHWIATPHGRLFAKSWQPDSSADTRQAPIVLLHDSLGCVELWRRFPERLARATGRQVVAYDRLGFGQSDRYPGSLPADFVSGESQDGFSAICHQLAIDDFIVFGHSVGGGMAASCAAVFADRCRALITESAQAFVEDRTLEGIRIAQQGFDQPGQLDRLKRYHGDKAAWVLSAWVDNWLSEGFRDWTLNEVLPSVRCPVLAIHGEQDEYGSLRHPERIAALAGGSATIEIVADCRHLPHHEQPDQVLAAITTFLNTLADQPVAAPPLHPDR